MCGIVGSLYLDGRRAEPEVVRNLTALITHRGPDEEGFFFHESYGCGSRRLSIIDLENGTQPLLRRGGDLSIVYNGEVYNYRSLREELRGKGYRFSTETDTEVVLAAYEEWGEECLRRFNGMFALAIYDRRSGELFLARDRLGIKQLYCYHDGRSFLFASEMKAVMAHPGVPRRLNVEVLSRYMAYGYYDCGGDTPVRGIRLLSPGSYLKVSAGKGGIEEKTWWRIPPQAEGKYGSAEEAARGIYSLLVDSVRRRLAGDVKICVMLSSGLDSGALAYILHRELKVPMKAYSVGLESPEFDESEDAGELARSFGMEWERRFIGAEDVRRDFDDIIFHTDSLQGNTAQIIYYYGNRLIHEGGFKVTLNGSGGDELFIGYPTFRADALFRWYRHLPAALRAFLHRLADRLPASTSRVSFDYRLKKFTEFSGDDPLRAHAYWRTLFSDGGLERLFRREWHDRLSPWSRLYDSYYRTVPDMPFWNKVQAADFACWLIPLLSWVDNMSMAHSVELRVPFLDHRLVEEVVGLPPEYKFRGVELKKLMKSFLKGRIPDRARRLPKRGTHLPLGSWLKTDLRELQEEHLSEERIKEMGLFEPAPILHMREEHRLGRRDHTFRLWNLVIFSAWARTFEVTA